MAMPVQKQFTVHIRSGEQGSNQHVTIPAGKNMTITHVSGRLTVPASQAAEVSVQTVASQIDVPGGTTTGYHFFPTVTELGNQVVFGQSTNIVAMGGNVVVLTVWRTGSTGILDGQVTIHGQLLP
jgi:hypothetical protein